MRDRSDLTIVTVLLILVLAGCGHPLPEESRAGADASLTVAAVFAQPDAAVGQVLVLGGSVVRHAGSDGGSLLEILPWRINRWGEPLFPEETAKTLLIQSAEPLDPAIYEPGILVTLAGRVLGLAPESTSPLLALTGIHAWDSPFRYGIRSNPDPAEPQYVGSDDDIIRHPYDPGYSIYPFTPYSYRQTGPFAR